MEHKVYILEKLNKSLPAKMLVRSVVGKYRCRKKDVVDEIMSLYRSKEITFEVNENIVYLKKGQGPATKHLDLLMFLAE